MKSCVDFEVNNSVNSTFDIFNISAINRNIKQKYNQHSFHSIYIH